VDNGTLVIYSEAAAAAAAASKDPSSLWTVRFSPDGKYIATGGEDRHIKVCS
jgi:WD40 repeat protein